MSISSDRSIAWLCSNNYDPEKFSPAEKTKALQLAALAGELDVCKFLVNSCKKKPIQIHDDILIKICQDGGSLEVAKLLFDVCPTLLLAQKEQRRTALHELVIAHKGSESKGATFLELATWILKEDSKQLLLNIKDAYGRTPLMLCKTVEMSALLIQYGAAVCPFTGAFKASRILQTKESNHCFLSIALLRIVGEHTALHCLVSRLDGHDDAMKDIATFAGIKYSKMTQVQLQNTKDALACLEAEAEAAAKKWHASKQKLTRLGTSLEEQEENVKEYLQLGEHLKVLFFSKKYDYYEDEEEEEERPEGDY